MILLSLLCNLIIQLISYIVKCIIRINFKLFYMYFRQCVKFCIIQNAVNWVSKYEMINILDIFKALYAMPKETKTENNARKILYFLMSCGKIQDIRSSMNAKNSLLLLQTLKMTKCASLYFLRKGNNLWCIKMEE